MPDVLLAGFHLQRPLPDLVPSAVAQALFEQAVAEHWPDRAASLTQFTVTLDGYFPRASLRSGPPEGGRGSSTINLPFLRELGLACSTLAGVRRWRRGGGPSVILTCFHYLPVSAALLAFGRITRTPVIAIFTDLPLFSYSSARIAAMPAWKRPVMASYRRASEWLCQRYDGYVLFTAAMGEIVNPAGRPAIVVEGMFNDHGLAAPTGHKQQHVIAHAGTLDREYGIETLLDAFATITDPRARLWLFGSGDMDAEIERRAAEDPRIVAHGFRPRAEVFARLWEATLLVNLRDPSAKFTRYSFPSKMFEYLATGSAVATTALAGIPEDYYQHVAKLEWGSPRSLGAQLAALLELESFQQRAPLGRSFVLQHKTATPQTRRIADFVIARMDHTESRIS